jgi:hypothetical protein
MEREREREKAPDDPTVEADEADPTEPGPGDSEGARPEPGTEER